MSNFNYLILLFRESLSPLTRGWLTSYSLRVGLLGFGDDSLHFGVEDSVHQLLVVLDGPSAVAEQLRISALHF